MADFVYFDAFTCFMQHEHIHVYYAYLHLVILFAEIKISIPSILDLSIIQAILDLFYLFLYRLIF